MTSFEAASADFLRQVLQAKVQSTTGRGDDGPPAAPRFKEPSVLRPPAFSLIFASGLVLFVLESGEVATSEAAPLPPEAGRPQAEEARPAGRQAGRRGEEGA